MYHRHSAGVDQLRRVPPPRQEGRARPLRPALPPRAATRCAAVRVVGASIWDSDNRWLTIHGTNYLVVRDCVGYQSVGHGFFLEDGTEVYNVLDRNLAVGAAPRQAAAQAGAAVRPNDGAGFWWANSLNTLHAQRRLRERPLRLPLRGDADRARSSSTLPVLQPRRHAEATDIRTLPFVRFDDNEVHCSDGLYGVNLGEGVDRVGPDARHPFVVREPEDLGRPLRASARRSPSLLVENLRIRTAVYGVYHPNYDNHVYRNVTISRDERRAVQPRPRRRQRAVRRR